MPNLKPFLWTHIFLCSIICHPTTVQCTTVTEQLQQCSRDLKLPMNCTGFNTYCASCTQDDDDEHPKTHTVCFLKDNEMALMLEQLGKIPTAITSLQLVINNTWQGYLPLTPGVVNITGIRVLIKLRQFQLQLCHVEYLQHYPLYFQNDTFINLTDIQYLHINLPIADISLAPITSCLRKLKVLDLSFTRNICMKNMIKTLREVNNETLEKMVLITFQGIFNDNSYNGTLDLYSFLGKPFKNLIEFNISENSLIMITPGLQHLLPNLKYLAVAGNILLTSRTTVFLLEALLHPKIEIFDYSHQGTIANGEDYFRHGKYDYYNSIGNPTETNEEMLKALQINGKQEDFQLNGKDPLGSNLLPKERKTYQTRAESFLSENGRRDFYSLHEEDKGNKFSKVLRLLSECVNDYVKGSDASPNVTFLFNTSSMTGVSTAAATKRKEQKFLQKVLACLLPLQFDGLPYESLPPLREIYSFSCILCIMFPIAPNLQTLYLDNLHWEKTTVLGLNYDGNMCFRKNSLINIIFKNNKDWLKPAKLVDILNQDTNFVGLDSVKTIDLSYNNMYLRRNIGDEKYPLSNLEYLNLGGNNISLTNNHQYCKGKPNLEVLILKHNNLGLNNKSFHKDLLADCSNLKVLDLTYNMLDGSHLDQLNLTGLKNLKLLNLSHNHISNLSKSFTNKLETIIHSNQDKLVMDLSHNKLRCDCPVSDFTEWMVTKHPGIEIKYKIHTYCLDGQGVLRNYTSLNINSVKKFRRQCSHLDIILKSIGFTLMGIILIVCLVTAYKRRWMVRYKIFQLEQYIHNLISGSDIPMAHYTYDAYVSHFSEDRFWVHDCLAQKLEKECSFKLCMRFRDFPLGGGYAEAIVEGISNSRDVIIVLTKGYLKSHYRRFELEQALVQSMERHRRLILIKLGALENICDNYLAASVLDTHVFLEWPNESNAKELFWKRLLSTLYDENEPVFSHCTCCRRRQGYTRISSSISQSNTP